MKAELVVATSSVVVAVCGLLFTVWQASQTRKHNRLSVKPKLVAWQHHHDPVYQIEIVNNGLGPAIIDSFKVLLDGVEVPGNGTNPIEKVLYELFQGYGYSSRQSAMESGHALAPSERVSVLSFQFNSDDCPDQNGVLVALDRAELQIKYSSIYEEKFTFTSKQKI